jgi:hypothetical protein
MRARGPGQERPGEVMQVISQVANDAVILESERDEADTSAPVLLAEAQTTQDGTDPRAR